MNKREFLSGAALGAAALAGPAHAAPRTISSPALLTVTGAIGRGNRGPLDPALDQMMKKQGIRFDKAHAFDFASLVSLPAVTIRPTLEYDGKIHALRGPLLTDVLAAAGVRKAQAELVMRAIDGYAPTATMSDILKYRFIIATHLDGKPMPVGGLGPLWALYDADRFPDMAAKPVNERFGNCPWGLYHIDVH
ncbi:molybdopterin-dependent oxidoreductase [Noviherbaspirillum sp. ST9]|uniref:molybdopterin-dependent oxidoreductase n=1 Tax=Noviherbaspirillum sp. ST9 TaxID=3401606 RepID=UPI003B5888A0